MATCGAWNGSRFTGLFSTVVHRFPQIFWANSLDAVRENIYLARQIEPEAKKTYRFDLESEASRFRISEATGKLKDFPIQRRTRDGLTAVA